MMLPPSRYVGYFLRILVAAACCYGIWCSLTLARADYLFKKDTEASVRSAIRLVPDGWQYYMRLAQFDKANAQALLATSLRLNRYDSQANIELGLWYEAEGDFGRAEKQFLEAFEVDHTYLPRWSLANFYFRRDNMPAFWTWARTAAAMPADDVGSLFELCWRASPDPQAIAKAVLNENPGLIRQYMAFLLAKDQPKAIDAVAPLLIAAGDPGTDRSMLLGAIDRLIAANDGAEANALWRLLVDKRWVIADTGVPNNPGFQREPLPVGFDWSLPEYQGLHSWPGASGLETEFTGSQPEDCTIAEQAVVLTPGSFSMSYTYRTSDIPPETGIRWHIVDTRSNAVLAESSDLSSDALVHSAFVFSVPPGASLFRMRLSYHRALGTPRVSGMLDLQYTKIEVLRRP